MVYDFDGAKVYENISSADFGTMTAFLTSILFFLFTVVCGFIVVLTVLNRILKIYMIAPFAGVALSTLAAKQVFSACICMRCTNPRLCFFFGIACLK